MKIKAKIFASFAIIYLIFAVIEIGFFYFFVEDVFKKNIYKNLQTTASLRADTVENFIKAAKSRAIDFASDKRIKDCFAVANGNKDINCKKEDLQKHLNEKKLIFPEIAEIFAVGPNGNKISPTIKDNDLSAKSIPCYKHNTKRSLFQGLCYLQESKKNLITISAPVIKDSRLEGVLVLRVSPNELYSSLSSRSGLGKTGEVYLVNKEKFIISPSIIKKDVVLRQKINTQNANTCLKNKGAFDQRGLTHTKEFFSEYKTANLVGTHEYLLEPECCLLVEKNTAEAFAPLKNIIKVFSLVGFILLLLFYLTANWIGRRITKPIVLLQRGAKIIEKGKLTHKVGTKSKDEIGVLSRAFDNMTKKLRVLYLGLEKKVRERTKDLEKFKLAVQNASDLVVITDPKGKILYINKAGEKITGFVAAELLGKKAWSKESWGMMNEKFYKKLWKTLTINKKTFSSKSVKNKTKNNKEYDAEIKISPILDKKKVLFFVGIERDITKEREIDRAKSDFVSLASHQLSTPLSTVKWYAEFLNKKARRKLNEKEKKYLDELYKSNERMLALIDDFLNVSKIEMGTFYMKPKPTDINKVMRNTLKEFLPQIAKKKLKIKKTFYKKSISLNIDPKLLSMVFSNLLSNAVKYSNKEGKIEIETERQGSKALISIADSGCGIPKDEQSKIFTRLFRAQNVYKQYPAGTGLGLYIAKNIVDKLGGKIWFESDEGKGATFFVELLIKNKK